MGIRIFSPGRKLIHVFPRNFDFLESFVFVVAQGRRHRFFSKFDLWCYIKLHKTARYGALKVVVGKKKWKVSFLVPVPEDHRSLELRWNSIRGGGRGRVGIREIGFEKENVVEGEERLKRGRENRTIFHFSKRAVGKFRRNGSPSVF